MVTYNKNLDEDEIDRHAIRSLINVSKILNNLAHNIDEKFEGKEYEKMQSFIVANHPILTDNLRRLLVRPFYSNNLMNAIKIKN